MATQRRQRAEKEQTMRTIPSAVAILTAALVSCGTSSAYAQARSAAPGPGARAPATAPAPRQALPAVPNLTAKQREQIQALRVATYDKVAPLQRDLMVKRGELRALWAAPQPNREAILKKQAEMDGVRQKIREAHVEQHLAMLKVLTPEQRAAMPPAGSAGFGAGGCMGPGSGAGMGRGMGRGMGPRGWWAY
jgi:Spy/CpxP family protein refolding chaperone